MTDKETSNNRKAKQKKKSDGNKQEYKFHKNKNDEMSRVKKRSPWQREQTILSDLGA